MFQTSNVIPPRFNYQLIVAVDMQGGFGKDGKLPWHYGEDLKRFRELTSGHVCVMGRKSYDEINDKIGEKGATSVLPNRKCIVLTSTDLPRANATAVKSIHEIESVLTDDDVGKTVFVIGGESVFTSLMSKCDVLNITIVNDVVNADRFFPTRIVLSRFDCTEATQSKAEPKLCYTTWRRRR